MHGTQDDFGQGFGAGSGQGFGPAFGRGFGGPGAHMWDAMDHLRTAFERGGPFERRGGSRMGRGDVRAAVLALLAERPMHGYQIIQEIEERSGGAWKPSPGSVYPTLQLLADEGLITASEADGRKTYALSEGGRAEADAAADRHAPWLGQAEGERPPSRLPALPKAGLELAQAAAQVGRTGSPAQVQEAVEVLEAARRRLYAILAQD